MKLSDIKTNEGLKKRLRSNAFFRCCPEFVNEYPDYDLIIKKKKSPKEIAKFLTSDGDILEYFCSCTGITFLARIDGKIYFLITKDNPFDKTVYYEDIFGKYDLFELDSLEDYIKQESTNKAFNRVYNVYLRYFLKINIDVETGEEYEEKERVVKEKTQEELEMEENRNLIFNYLKSKLKT